jgi:hypothetical protein
MPLSVRVEAHPLLLLFFSSAVFMCGQSAGALAQRHSLVS